MLYLLLNKMYKIQYILSLMSKVSFHMMRITERCFFDCIIDIENGNQMFYLTFVLVKLAVPVTKMGCSYSSSTMREMGQLNIVYVLLMLTFVNLSQPKATAHMWLGVLCFTIPKTSKLTTLVESSLEFFK